MAGLGAFYELEIRCQGPADPTTGYLINISAIDEAARSHAIRPISDAFRAGGHKPEEVLASIWTGLAAALHGTLATVRWWLTPYYSLAMDADRPDRVLLAQHFEFCAAHRLHCPDLSDAENRSIFGKCNHPSGHGHNYRVEPQVSVELGEPEKQLRLADLERIVDEHVIQRFDHKHLNRDSPEFADLSPTVEHIARICYELLGSPIAEAGGHLVRVTVWETDKTSCTYPATA